MQSVIKISEAASIALHSMTYISVNNDRAVPIKEIAEKLKVSVHHLAKVLHKLVRAGLLFSSTGPGGGYRLARGCKDISFLDIYETIDGKIAEGCCLFGSQSCNITGCIMGNLLTKTNKEVKEFLKNRKLSDFCEQKKDLDNFIKGEQP